MGFFDSLVDKAKSKLHDFENPKDKIDYEKFKDPNYQEENYQEENQYNKNNNKKVNNEDQLIDPFSDGFFNEDPVNLYPSQKPESFHFFILENQYQDLERAIRGVKDVWDKENQRWVIKRKKDHCFTDEESEEIVRTAQSHLSSDIKLAIFNINEYPILLNSIYDQIWTLFRSIMEYRFGRFGNTTEQLKMKLQATNIFNMLSMRIKANYSRAVGGKENAATHDSVKGQESLSQPDRKDYGRGYT